MAKEGNNEQHTNPFDAYQQAVGGNKNVGGNKTVGDSNRTAEYSNAKNSTLSLDNKTEKAVKPVSTHIHQAASKIMQSVGKANEDENTAIQGIEKTVVATEKLHGTGKKTASSTATALRYLKEFQEKAKINKVNHNVNTSSAKSGFSASPVVPNLTDKLKNPIEGTPDKPYYQDVSTLNQGFVNVGESSKSSKKGIAGKSRSLTNGTAYITAGLSGAVDFVDKINIDGNLGVSAVTSTARVAIQAERAVEGTAVVVRSTAAKAKSAKEAFKRSLNFMRSMKGQSAAQVASKVGTSAGKFIIQGIKEGIKAIGSAILAVMSPILIFIIIIVLLSALIIIGLVAGSDVLTSYNTEDTTITETNNEMRDLVDDMKDTVETVETKPEYSHIDEFKFIPSKSAILAELDYDYFKLTAYLSAMYQNYQPADVSAELNAIFNELFQLNLNEVVEVRTRPDGHGGTEHYNYYILEISLTKGDLDAIIDARLGGNLVAKELYDIYMGDDLMGGHQMVANPFKMEWRSHLTSYYGSRYLEHIGEDFHTGIDIAFPQGTPIYAGVNGKVTNINTAYPYGNRAEITSRDGKIMVRYCHMHTINVSLGDGVLQGVTQVGGVGTTGNSTGNHLHIEVFVNGVRIDPLPLIQLDTNDFPDNTPEY